MPVSYADLLSAIDNQDLLAVNSFINNHPELDYSQVCPNGASALWWALMPPPGKSISPGIIEFLLNCTKNNGDKLLSPVQSFAGFRPSEYPCFIADAEMARHLDKIITDAENAYVAPVIAIKQNLVAIANDAQNAHNPLVVALTRSNIEKLYRHYILSSSCLLDEATVNEASNDLEQLISSEPIETRRKAMAKGLNYCKEMRSTFAFEIKAESKPVEVNLTLAQLFTLNWLAAKETNAELIPQDSNNPEGVTNRKNAILSIFYDIETAYKDLPSCPGGACNRFGIALAAQHNLVESAQKGAPITGDLAQQIFVKVLGETLGRLSSNNPQRYWQHFNFLFNTSSVEAQEAEKDYDAFINENSSVWLNKLVDKENIDLALAQEKVGSLKGNYPTEGHPLSYELGKLMPYLDEGFEAAFVKREITLEKAVQQAKELVAAKLLKNEVFLTRANEHGLNKDDLSPHSICSFVSLWLERTRRENKQFVLGGVMKGRADEKDKAEQAKEDFITESFRLFLFLKRKVGWKVQHSAQALWLDSLTLGDSVRLLDALEADLLARLGDSEDKKLLPALILKAQALGITANLVLEGIDLIIEDKDLRGHDFSGANLNGLTFRRCILPLVGANIRCETVILEDCFLANVPNDSGLSPDVIRLFERICSSRDGSALVIQFLLQSLNLSHKTISSGFWNALKYGSNDNVKVFLANKDYFQDLLNTPFGGNGDTPLIYAASAAGREEIATAILANPHCTQAMVAYANRDKYNALMIAAESGNTELVEVILANSHCTKAVVKQVSVYGNNAFDLADLRGYNYRGKPNPFVYIKKLILEYMQKEEVEQKNNPREDNLNNKQKKEEAEKQQRFAQQKENDGKKQELEQAVSNKKTVVSPPINNKKVDLYRQEIPTSDTQENRFYTDIEAVINTLIANIQQTKGGRWLAAKENDPKIKLLECLVGWVTTNKNQPPTDSYKKFILAFLHETCALHRSYISSLFFHHFFYPHSLTELPGLLKDNHLPCDYEHLFTKQDIKKMKGINKIEQINQLFSEKTHYLNNASKNQ